MKKIFLNVCVILLLMSLSGLSSCKKSNDSNNGSFTWTHKGKSYQATAAGGFTVPGYFFVPFNVLGGFGSFSTHVEARVIFHLTSFDVGSFTISSSGANYFIYTDDAGFNLDGSSGMINITSNTNGLSGNFSVTLVDASSATSQITGSFTNIAINPN